MKQRDIDRWVNRQTHMNQQATLNWALIASILVVIGVLLIVVLSATHIL